MSNSAAIGHSCNHAGDAATAAPAIDPVCGMKVDPALIQHHAEVDRIFYHFCSAGCRTKFVADPHRYTGRS